MKKILLFLISLLIGLGIFIWIGKTVGWKEIKETFLVFRGWQGMVILALTLLTISVGNWKWKEILKGEGVKISFGDLFLPYLAGFSIMFLAPLFILAGEFFRASVLKNKNSIPWSKGMASVFIDRILEWSANLVIIFFGLLFFLLTIRFLPTKFLIIFGGAFLFFALGIGYFYLKVFQKKSLFKLIAPKKFNQQNVLLEIEKEIFNFFKKKNKSMWKGFCLAFLRTGIMYLQVWLLIFFLGKEIPLLSALSILGFFYLAAMFPIPTALGSHEAIQTFSFHSLGLGSATATAFTMIVRGAELIVALAGVIFLYHSGIDFFKKNLFNQ